MNWKGEKRDSKEGERLKKSALGTKCFVRFSKISSSWEAKEKEKN